MYAYIPLVYDGIVRPLCDVIELVRHVRAVERAVKVMRLVRCLVDDRLQARVAEVVVIEHVIARRVEDLVSVYLDEVRVLAVTKYL